MTTPNHRWGIRYSSDVSKNLAYLQTQYNNDNTFAKPGELFLNENLQEVYYVDHSDGVAKKMSDVWSKTTDDVYYNAGRVGIGIDTPSSTLEVASTWNNSLINHSSVKITITDTASSSNSKPLEVIIDGNSKFAVSKAGGLTLSSKLNLPSQPPASATATGTTGDVAWDQNYIYICIATNTWKRSPLGTWV